MRTSDQASTKALPNNQASASQVFPCAAAVSEAAPVSSVFKSDAAAATPAGVGPVSAASISNVAADGQGTVNTGRSTMGGVTSLTTTSSHSKCAT